MATVLTTTYDSTANTNALTCTIASLATSTSLLAGRNTSIIDTTSANYVDITVFGQITTGTTPTTGKTIALYAYAPLKIASSTSTYPLAGSTAITESDAAATFDAEQIAGMRLVWATSNNATSDRAYMVLPTGLAQFFGGVLPPKIGLWLTHNTGVNLNATAGNHWLHWTGYKFTNT